MARGAVTTVENNFTRGLITEFTAMNFPENAITEGDNCVYSEFGSVTRRLGAEYENGRTIHTTASLSANPNSYTEFKWHSVSNLGTVSFVVQQVGEKLHFFSISTNSALSANKKSFSVDLTTFGAIGVSAATISTSPCQYTAGRGYLVVVHPFCDPFFVAYDAGTDSITSTKITIEIRDFEGVEDGYEIDERRTQSLAAIDPEHHYNLLNQGWYASAGVFNVTSSTPVLPRWDAVRADLPSNSDVWWTFKQANESYEPNLPKHALTNTPAPKGHYIYNALDINRTLMTGISGLPTTSAGSARPSSVVFYAGRAFYAGVNVNKYSDKIYFSQIIDTDPKFGRCHQQNDPTSDLLADLLDNDGGVISLPLIETVTSMKVISDVLVVLATNGIYTITGTANGPFKATDYTVSYVSSIGASSHLSMIEVDNGLMWWNNDGIYALTRDNIGTFGVTNVSQSTIQTFFNTIPSENLAFVKGAYNKKTQLVQWIFSDDEALTGYRYNRILEFNVSSKAFYPFTIDTTLAPRISGIVSVGGQREILSLENVTDNALVVVTNNAAQNIQIQVSEFAPNSELFKYTTTGLISGGSSGLTYSELWNADLVDWESFNSVGASYDSYGISGYRIRGELLRPFTSTPVTFIVKNLETGRCLVSPIWDYNFRHGSTSELYLTRPEVDYIIRRVKFRGKGKSMQVLFQSVGNAPFNLTGWATFDTGGQVP